VRPKGSTPRRLVRVITPSTKIKTKPSLAMPSYKVVTANERDYRRLAEFRKFQRQVTTI
jgi:hypothetical protein